MPQVPPDDADADSGGLAERYIRNRFGDSRNGRASSGGILNANMTALALEGVEQRERYVNVTERSCQQEEFGLHSKSMPFLF